MTAREDEKWRPSLFKRLGTLGRAIYWRNLLASTPKSGGPFWDLWACRRLTEYQRHSFFCWSNANWESGSRFTTHRQERCSSRFRGHYWSLIFGGGEQVGVAEEGGEKQWTSKENGEKRVEKQKLFNKVEKRILLGGWLNCLILKGRSMEGAFRLN